MPSQRGRLDWGQGCPERENIMAHRKSRISRWGFLSLSCLELSSFLLTSLATSSWFLFVLMGGNLSKHFVCAADAKPCEEGQCVVTQGCPCPP